MVLLKDLSKFLFSFLLTTEVFQHQLDMSSFTFRSLVRINLTFSLIMFICSSHSPAPPPPQGFEGVGGQH
jgi:hypothetical protein